MFYLEKQYIFNNMPIATNPTLWKSDDLDTLIEFANKDIESTSKKSSYNVNDICYFDTENPFVGSITTDVCTIYYNLSNYVDDRFTEYALEISA